MRSFLILWIGQGLSFLGSNLTKFGLGVWAFQQSGQVTDFALIAFAGALPESLLGLVAGTFADRHSRKLIMMLAQTLAAGVTVILALLFWTDALEFWHILVLAMLYSASNAFFMPALRSSIALIVPKEKLNWANGASGLNLGLIQLIAPTLGGVLLVSIGVLGLVVIDALTFIVGLTSLALIRVPNPSQTPEHIVRANFASELIDGWRYLTARNGLFRLFQLGGALVFLNAALGVLITPMVLGFSDPKGLGLVISAGGLGTAIGSIAVMQFKESSQLVPGIFRAVTCVGVGVILMPLRPSVTLVAVGAFVIMSAVPFASTYSQTLFQRKVHANYQGRVFGLRGSLAGIMMPLGFLFAGPCADYVFEPLMQVGGAWSGLLGNYYGIGPGRGVAVFVSVLGIATLLLVTKAYFTPALVHLERDIVDVDLNEASL